MLADWSDKNYAARYNSVYATPAEEFQACLDKLSLSGTDSLLDLGCGNGDFLLLASRRVSKAVGVDISGPQADAAEQKLKGAPNARIVRSSFMEFSPAGEVFTRGFARKSLHHLTDPEKRIFFSRLAPAFPPGSLFLMEDVIFDFERAELDKHWDKLLSEAEKFYGPAWEAKKKDVPHTFREEFPTGYPEWERIFGSAGFQIIGRERTNYFYGSLLAKKLSHG